MTHQSPFWKGEKFGFRYRFDKAGDGLPVHQHLEAELRHRVYCVAGRVAVIGLHWSLILLPGALALFDSSAWHQVLALDDNSVIENELIDGFPACYENQRDLSGCFSAGLELSI